MSLARGKFVFRYVASTRRIQIVRPLTTKISKELFKRKHPIQRIDGPSCLFLSRPHSKENDTKNDDFLSDVQKTLCQDILPNVLKEEHDRRILLVVAVSGGCDSVGLLHALLQILEKRENTTYTLRCSKDEHIDCDVHVAHFDHEQRGSESDKDREFVQDLCTEMGLPLTCYYWSQYENKPSTFTQEVARDWRRAKLMSLLDQNEADQGIILTAHHSDDDLETLLFKLLRGVHITNLSGMEAMTIIGDRYVFARPMINVKKADILSFLESQGLQWREDSSNASNKYKRNRIRNELIPLLNDIVGGGDVLQKRMRNLSQQSTEIKQDLTTRAQAYLDEKEENHCFFLPPVLTLTHKQAMHIWAEKQMRGRDDTTSSFSYEQQGRLWNQLQQHPANKSWILNMGSGWNVVRTGDVLELNRDKEDEENDAAVEFEEKSVPWTIVDTSHEPQHDEVVIQLPSAILEQVDWMKTYKFMLSNVEHNRELLFTPAWRPDSNIKLGQFLRGQHVPLHRRRHAPLVVLEGPKSKAIVAVYAEKDSCSESHAKGKWILDAEFDLQKSDDGPLVLLQLNSC